MLRSSEKMLLSVVLAAVTIPVSAQDTLSQANAALQSGQADHALALLSPLASSGANQAQAHNLECRVRYTLEQWEDAVSQCEQAVQLDPRNSDFHLWLGRALGEKADRASFLKAYSIAKRVRPEFAEAVKLDTRNAEAWEALGEFDVQAPGLVGGGIDKAEADAAQLAKIDPARAYELRGRIAEQRKDYAAAEREFKLATTTGAHPALQWETLAGFYSRRRQWPQMESALHSLIAAIHQDNHASFALYDGAGLLIESKQNPSLAAKMLQQYLAGPQKSEKAPAFIAHDRLAGLEDQLGDAAAAGRERAASRALAREYKPVQKETHNGTRN